MSWYILVNKIWKTFSIEFTQSMIGNKIFHFRIYWFLAESWLIKSLDVKVSSFLRRKKWQNEHLLCYTNKTRVRIYFAPLGGLPSTWWKFFLRPFKGCSYIFRSSAFYTSPPRVAVIVEAFSKMSSACLGLLDTITKPELNFCTVLRESFSNPKLVFRANLIACTCYVELGWFLKIWRIFFFLFFICWGFEMGTKEGFSGRDAAGFADEDPLAVRACVCGTLCYAWAWEISWLGDLAVENLDQRFFCL